jgi:hypothetical protein
MNRSILIVICDFLLVSLLAFSTVDIQKVTDQTSPRTVSVEIATNRVDNHLEASKDLTAVMRMALNEERKEREQLLSELSRTRETATRQQSLAGERERQVQAIQQELKTREAEAQRLQQQQTALQEQKSSLQQQQAVLQQQYSAAQTNLQTLNQQLQATSAEALFSKEKLAALEAEARKRAEQAAAQAAALQKQVEELGKKNEAAQAEKQQLASRLQVAEVERRVAAEHAARVDGEIKIEREEKAKLAEGVKTLASKSTELTQEIRANRPLAANAVFNEFATNKVQASFYAARSLLFGIDGSKSKETAMILAGDGTNVMALCHVQDTPLAFSDPGTDWEGLTGTLNRNSTALPITSLSFYQLDPRVVMIPVTAEQVRALGGKVYRFSTDPYKFQDAVLVGASEGYYGECRFQLDLTTPLYVKMDHNSIKGLFGKFNPSRGDLVLSKTGELLGVMANSTYCIMIRNFNPTSTFEFGSDVRPQRTGATLARLYGLIANLPSRLQ